MSAWGPAIFSDDLACDVRDDYRELIEDGVDDDQAVDTLLGRYSNVVGDPDDGPVFWLALALTQSKVGRLREDVKQRALAIIDEGADLDRWDDPATRRKREAALEKARETLTGPQPGRRRLRRPSRHETSLNPGDVLATDVGGQAVLLRVARLDDHRTSLAPILAALDYDGRKVPSSRRLQRLQDRTPVGPRSDPVTGLLPSWHSTTFRVIVHKKVDYADAGFAVIGSTSRRPGDDSLTAQTYCTWAQLRSTIERNVRDRT